MHAGMGAGAVSRYRAGGRCSAHCSGIAAISEAMLPAEWKLHWPYAPAIRSRNGIAYLTVRRFSAQDRLNTIRAIKQLKTEADDRETGLAAAEMALLWLRLTGNPGAWTVTSVAPSGFASISSGGNRRNSFGCETPLIGRSRQTCR